MPDLPKLYMGTNTKMFKTIEDTVAFLTQLSALTEDIPRQQLELFVIPSYTTLYHARQTVPSQSIKLGAQNMCWEKQGQFTGEVSPLMLQELGMDMVLIGHSERRHVFGETDAQENLKVRSALRHGLTALFCIGETEEQKECDVSDEVLRIQLKCGLKDVTRAMAHKLWVAYEPVWAIGVGGKPASADYADQKHAVIRRCLIDLFGQSTGGSIPILYGGSVNNQNAAPLIQMKHIDGLFIGRSAWQADNFNSILRQVLPLFRARKRAEAGEKADV